MGRGSGHHVPAADWALGAPVRAGPREECVRTVGPAQALRSSRPQSRMSRSACVARFLQSEADGTSRRRWTAPPDPRQGTLRGHSMHDLSRRVPEAQNDQEGGDRKRPDRSRSRILEMSGKAPAPYSGGTVGFGRAVRWVRVGLAVLAASAPAIAWPGLRATRRRRSTSRPSNAQVGSSTSDCPARRPPWGKWAIREDVDRPGAPPHGGSPPFPKR